ncbi:hypothetical protein ACN47E_002040 [Coniothyrium glycines]
MGRVEKSKCLAPPAVRKDVRAKQARYIINKVVPAVLASNPRARRGSENSRLYVDPLAYKIGYKMDKEGQIQHCRDVAFMKRKGQGRRKARVLNEENDEHRFRPFREGHQVDARTQARTTSLDETVTDTDPASQRSPIQQRRIRIMITDSLTASHMLSFPNRYRAAGKAPIQSSKKQPNVCVLNMASPLRPGGGVLSGATSQEEFLCARTTLLPSLREHFYRLPELGGIYTNDVLVLRNASPLGDNKGELVAGERWWIDVISAGMLRFPELVNGSNGVETLNKKDRGMVEAKMRAVLHLVASKGAKKLVLGAWGCGAYGNPLVDVAQAWRKVLDNELSDEASRPNLSSCSAGTWSGIEDVIFSINDRKMAHDFANAFGGEIQVEAGPVNTEDDDDGDEDTADCFEEELRSKILELETQLSSVWNYELRKMMESILSHLQAQLRGCELEIQGVEEDSPLSEEGNGGDGHEICDD